MKKLFLLLLLACAGLPVSSAQSPDCWNNGLACTQVGAQGVTVDHVQVNPITVAVGATGQMTAQLIMSDGSQGLVSTGQCVWSSSNNAIATISSTGLVTGVAAGSATMTCMWGGANGLSGSGLATVSAPPLITNPAICASPPCALPNGINGQAYSFSFAAIGGTPPYTWSVSAGSLPGWASLSSSGCGSNVNCLLSGTAATGTASFTIKVTDSGANFQTLALTLATTAPTCGPPTYPCSNTTLNVIQPSATPFTTCTGANTQVTPADFGNPIERLSDCSFDPSLPNVNIGPPCGGNAQQNPYNTNSTLMILCATGGRIYPVSHNTTTQQITRLYTAQFPASNGFFIGNSMQQCFWSRSTSTLLYCYATKDTQIYTYDFSDLVNPPTGTVSGATVQSAGGYNTSTPPTCSITGGGGTGATCTATTIFVPSAHSWILSSISTTPGSGYYYAPTISFSGSNQFSAAAANVQFSGRFATLYDFTSSANGIGKGFVANALATCSTCYFIASGFESASDNSFVFNFSNAGGQDTSCFFDVYTPGSGLRQLNTCTGVITGDYGPAGTISIADRWHMHDAFATFDKNWAIPGFANCIQNCTNPQASPYFWNVPTMNVYQPGPNASGHWEFGYSHWWNNSGLNSGNPVLARPYTNLSSTTSIITAPPNIVPPYDPHGGTANMNAADTNPIIVSGTCVPGPCTPYTFAWNDEVDAWDPTGTGKVWRFAHTFCSGKNLRAPGTQYCYGQPSQDGKFYLFSSDMLGNLGSESGSSTCTLPGVGGQTACRGDAFEVRLQ